MSETSERPNNITDSETAKGNESDQGAMPIKDGKELGKELLSLFYYLVLINLKI